MKIVMKKTRSSAAFMLALVLGCVACDKVKPPQPEMPKPPVPAVESGQSGLDIEARSSDSKKETQ
jgi:hypothetical protein